ncbi:hypothetical protein BKA67DRAFT_113957 [Truncatella angustata]|uniref:Zn(2)-C6 fungal-type domain-containing protein n=1 Tax=Truncatella angustata TaxID=152316 RepID=A0A9P8RLV7_9PEZI|nr:uncharacterized protein BKA67DRAFT_113957 [Truncatella angustata]KAH6645506.1 hypothetical protein BKA67DRAFT_113957 [Truncatella angustata]KAH8196470.1 hypothetical protein TruAng_009368 [Truncatella angustata]
MSTGSASTKKMKRQPTHADDVPAEAQVPPAPKRQRVSRACDQCRAAREKCDGIQPLCFPCASQNRQCTWEEPKKKRGVQTGYIRTLELSLGWIFDKIPGSEEALHGLLTHEGGQGRALLLGKDTAAGNRLHRRWRKSIVQQEIDRVLSGGDTAPSKAEKPSPADDSDSSLDDAEPPPKEEGSAAHDRASLIAPMTETATGAVPDMQHTELALEPSSKLVKLPSNCWRLLDIYFSYSHCWFPILEKGLVHKACWSYPGEGLDLTDTNVPRSGSHAELWAALAVAAYQDEGTQAPTMYDESEAQMQPEDIYDAARRLIPGESAAVEPRHVNALLLLALVDIGRREYTAAWVSTGLATRIALAQDLQSQPVRNGNRRPYHTYMACFILDTLVATQINQPPHLRASNVSPIAPCGDDDQDEWDIWSPCQGFGPARPSGSSSRSPAHSMSSFAALFGILRVHCAMVFEADAEQREPYLIQVQKAIGGNPARQSFVNYVTNGGVPPYHVPSIYLLRLIFLCCGSQTQVYCDSLPSTVLQCLEEHMLSFGSAIPPLFSLFMDVLKRQYSPDLLKGDTRDRWKQIQSSIDSVWRPRHSQSTSPVAHKPPDSATSYINPHSTNVLYSAATSMPAVIQQLPTPSSHYADTPAEQAATMIGGDIYHDTSMSAMMSFPMASRSRQPVNLMDQPANGPAASRYDLADMSTQHFPLHGRPSFSSATFDYDSILDDIASLDRADHMGDPQFMANLGFAPGSDLTELLAHDFTSIT